MKETFGSKIRKQLANPKSELSLITERWRTWKYLVKTSPEKYKIVWHLIGFDLVEMRYDRLWKRWDWETFEEGSVKWLLNLITDENTVD